MIKRLKTSALYIIFFLVMILYSANILYGSNETDSSELKFSLGYRLHYAWLSPYWERLESKLLTTNYYYDIRQTQGDNFIYNPIFSIYFNNKWSITGSYQEGVLSYRGYYYYLTQFYATNFELEKYDIELQISYTINRYVRFFFGPKYQAYVTVKGINTPGIPSSTVFFYNAIGIGTGFIFVIPLAGPLYLLTGIAAVIMYGASEYSHEFVKGNSRSDIVGAIGNIGILVAIRSMNITLSLGVKVQAFNYTRPPYNDFGVNWEYYYGPNVSVIYRFSI